MLAFSIVASLDAGRGYDILNAFSIILPQHLKDSLLVLDVLNSLRLVNGRLGHCFVGI